MKIVFASHNKNKTKEINAILQANGSSVEVVTLDDMGLTEDIDETADTLEGNALIKARYAFQHTGKESFADDTGLEVEALNGAPGVHTARYAGDECDPKKNMAKLINALNGIDNRNARFRTVIAHIDAQGNETLLEGIVQGRIALKESGSQGFGYDPIFIPNENNTEGNTFAEMGLEVKNLISHRARAIAKLVQLLSKK